MTRLLKLASQIIFSFVFLFLAFSYFSSSAHAVSGVSINTPSVTPGLIGGGFGPPSPWETITSSTQLCNNAGYGINFDIGITFSDKNLDGSDFHGNSPWVSPAYGDKMVFLSSGSCTSYSLTSNILSAGDSPVGKRIYAQAWAINWDDPADPTYTSATQIVHGSGIGATVAVVLTDPSGNKITNATVTLTNGGQTRSPGTQEFGNEYWFYHLDCTSFSTIGISAPGFAYREYSVSPDSWPIVNGNTYYLYLTLNPGATATPTPTPTPTPTATPAPPQPVDPISANPYCFNNDSKVDLSWTRKQTGMNYEIWWNGGNINVGDQSVVTVNGWSPNIAITWYVRAFVPSTGYAGPSRSGTFTTATNVCPTGTPPPTSTPTVTPTSTPTTTPPPAPLWQTASVVNCVNSSTVRIVTNYTKDPGFNAYLYLSAVSGTTQLIGSSNTSGTVTWTQSISSLPGTIFIRFRRDDHPGSSKPDPLDPVGSTESKSLPDCTPTSTPTSTPTPSSTPTPTPTPSFGTIHIRVRASDNSGFIPNQFVSGATVKVMNTSNTPLAGKVAVSDSDGWVTITNVPAGQVHMIAYKSGYGGRWKQQEGSCSSVTPPAVSSTHGPNANTESNLAAYDDQFNVIANVSNGCNDLGLVKQPDYTLSLSPSTQQVNSGGSVPYSLTINPSSCPWPGSITVNLAYSYAASDGKVTISKTPPPGSPDSSVVLDCSTSKLIGITVSVTNTVVAGSSYTLTVNGSGSGIPNHSASAQLTINAGNWLQTQAGDFYSLGDVQFSAPPPSGFFTSDYLIKTGTNNAPNTTSSRNWDVNNYGSLNSTTNYNQLRQQVPSNLPALANCNQKPQVTEKGAFQCSGSITVAQEKPNLFARLSNFVQGGFGKLTSSVSKLISWASVPKVDAQTTSNQNDSRVLGSGSVTCTLSSASDSGNIAAASSTYPPSATSIYSIGVSRSSAGRYYNGQYNIINGFLRWNVSTCGLPSGATITSASINIYGSGSSGFGNANGRNLTADWQNNWYPLSSASYSTTSLNNAISGFNLNNINIDGYTSIPLTNISNINTSGYTGLRFHIDGGQPAGLNYFFPSQNYTTAGQQPQLVLNYTTPDPSPTVPTSAPGGSLGQTVVYVNGDMTIANNINYSGTNNVVLYVVNGKVTINNSVTRVDAYIFAEKGVSTTSDPSSTACQLVINGGVAVGPSAPNGSIQFNRKLNSAGCSQSPANTPAEKIVYDPRVLIAFTSGNSPILGGSSGVKFTEAKP